ncbi:MerR family transcriptional regulator [Nocardia cyriacigeorgica]|uniref:DNA polymerase III subunit beta family protein n=1 Tax=Nocardia cyriacigeorgica TaxID=135487 RepID=UPI001893F7D9|nr:MerR family transcriptional regulator [Nocardia cyriacigeorgica]MBF6083230.1 MerR family transcriptional regulator [Nocardia cyriacigeorgica]
MTADRQLITIGVLARACGLTPSALRFYDDCGLLVPAEVDAATGYRYYTDDQRTRAVLIRRLRDIGIGLDTVAAILSAEPCEAARLLDEHVDAMARRAEDAAATAASIKSELAAASRVSLPGALLAEAIRQVGSALARDAEFPVLAGIFVEAAREAVVLTATDRYRLTTRTLVPRSWTGEPWSRVVDGAELERAVPWLTAHDDITLSPLADAVQVSDGGIQRRYATIDAQFPDYRAMLADLAPVRTRVVVERRALVDIVEAGADLLCLSVRAGAVTVGDSVIRAADHPSATSRATVDTTSSAPSPGTDSGDMTSVRADGLSTAGATSSNPDAGTDGMTPVHADMTATGNSDSGTQPVSPATIPATVIGTDIALAFARSTLRPALTTAVGPDVMLDIAAPDLPVVIRSATDGDLTTLAMPTRLPTTSEENPA